jgi:hypothetical protein
MNVINLVSENTYGSATCPGCEIDWYELVSIIGYLIIYALSPDSTSICLAVWASSISTRYSYIIMSTPLGRYVPRF